MTSNRNGQSPFRWCTPAGLVFAPTERVRIASSGDLGIGTSAPDRHLRLRGTGDQEIRIESSDANGRQ